MTQRNFYYSRGVLYRENYSGGITEHYLYHVRTQRGTVDHLSQHTGLLSLCLEFKRLNPGLVIYEISHGVEPVSPQFLINNRRN